MLSLPTTLWRHFTRSWCQDMSRALTADRELHLPAGEACHVGSCAEVGPSVPRGGQRDQEGPIRVKVVARAQRDGLCALQRQGKGGRKEDSRDFPMSRASQGQEGGSGSIRTSYLQSWLPRAFGATSSGSHSHTGDLHPLQTRYPTPKGDPQPGWDEDVSLPPPVAYLCPGDSRGGHTSGIAPQGDAHSLGGGDEDRAKLNAGRNWEEREAPHAARPGPCPSERAVLCCLSSAEDTRPSSPQSQDAWYPATHRG